VIFTFLKGKNIPRILCNKIVDIITSTGIGSAEMTATRIRTPFVVPAVFK